MLRQLLVGQPLRAAIVDAFNLEPVELLDQHAMHRLDPFGAFKRTAVAVGYPLGDARLAKRVFAGSTLAWLC